MASRQDDVLAELQLLLEEAGEDACSKWHLGSQQVSTAWQLLQLDVVGVCVFWFSFDEVLVHVQRFLFLLADAEVQKHDILEAEST